MIDGNGRVIVQAALSLTLQPDLVPREAIEQADRGQVVLLPTERDDRVRAAIKLNRFIDAYLVIGRFIDPEVLAEIQRTEWRLLSTGDSNRAAKASSSHS